MENAKIIDATNASMGRLASTVAKRLLKGEKIVIINAEKAIITGNPLTTKKKYQERRARGTPQHGPFFPTKANAILRRTIRGMLPYKQATGRTAFRNLRVQIGSEGFENTEVEKMPAKIKSRYITIQTLSSGMR